MAFRRDKGFKHKCDMWIMQGVFKSGTDWRNAPYGTHAKCISCNIAYPLDSIDKFICLCCGQRLRTKSRNSNAPSRKRRNKGETMLKALDHYIALTKKQNVLKKTINNMKRYKSKIFDREMPDGITDWETESDKKNERIVSYFSHRSRSK